MLRLRILTAAVLIPLVLWAVLGLSSTHLGLVLIVPLSIGAWEWTRLMGLKALPARAAYLGVAVLGVWLVWPLAASGQVDQLLGVALVWWVLAFGWIVNYPRGLASGPTLAVVEALAGLLVLIPAWAAVIALHGREADGPYLVLFVLGLTWAADSGAYLAGRRWGSKKLAPRVSPGKTWAGLYGGLGAVGLAALALGPLLGMRGGSWIGFIVLSMIVGLFSVVGDLFESLVKRKAGLKDSGNILPGHGGVLDRIDSLTAAAPVFVLGLHLLEGGP